MTVRRTTTGQKIKQGIIYDAFKVRNKTLTISEWHYFPAILEMDTEDVVSFLGEDYEPSMFRPIWH